MNRSRSSLLIFILVLGFFAVLARSIQFQLSPDPRLRRLALEKSKLTRQSQSDDLLTSRGAILDRNGRDLAISIVEKSFFANPKLIKDPNMVAQKLAQPLQMPASKLKALLKQERYFVWLKREVDETTAKKIEGLELEGVYSRKESKRVYPAGDLAKTVIGVSGRDGQGLEGLEKQYDDYLRSSDKQPHIGIRDAMGRLLLFDDFEKEWFETHHLQTTLDIRLQKILEDELKATLQEKDAEVAEGILINPKNGEILAMASLEGRRLIEKNPIRNRSIADSYEPGSTFKIVLAAASLEHLHMSAESQIFGENGIFRVGDHFIKEYHSHKYGWLTLNELLEVSSNIAAAKLGLKMGAENLNSTLHSFGFGSTTGIDLPGEATGLLRNSSSWRPIELANISFGQGIAVTPIQMARAISAVANGGYLITPHLVSKVISPRSQNSEPEVIWKPELKREEMMPAARARAMTDMLIKVTREGSTGAQAAVEGYQVAGKTGTSEKLIEKVDSKGRKYKTYSLDHSIVSFAGYVPAYDPAFVLLVIYDDPSGRASGGMTAAPSFRRIASRALAVLGIPPDRTNTPNEIPKEVSKSENSSAPNLAKTPSHFVGKSFQEVLKEVRNLPLEQRAKIDLIGIGTAVREENDENDRLKVYFQ